MFLLFKNNLNYFCCWHNRTINVIVYTSDGLLRLVIAISYLKIVIFAFTRYIHRPYIELYSDDAKPCFHRCMFSFSTKKLSEPVDMQLMCYPTTYCSLQTDSCSLTGGPILGRNWDKSLKSFPPCYSQTPQLTDFTRPKFLSLHVNSPVETECTSAMVAIANFSFLNVASVQTL